MTTSRRSAHLGMLATGFIIAVCMYVIVAGSVGVERHNYGPLPQFQLGDVTGKVLSSSTFTSPVTVLYVYSVRCDVCNGQAPQLARWSQGYAPDHRVRFVGLHSTSKREVSEAEVKVQNVVAGMTFDTMMDSDGAVAAKLGVTGKPSLLIVDGAGVIRHRVSLRNVEDVTGALTDAGKVIDAVLSQRGRSTELLAQK
jgi:peroxiredoxin